MPQLMPLMWISSMFMVLLILIMLLNIHYYKNMIYLLMINNINNISKKEFKW